MYIFLFTTCKLSCLFLKVRCTGYSILASVIMCGEKELVKKLMSEWTPCEKFSVWGSCMSVGIDLKEWSVVRQQVWL